MDLPEPRAGAAPAAEVESRAGAAPAAADESLGVDGVAGTNAPVTAPDALAAASDIRPHRSLWLLAIAHAVNHAQAVVLPLIFLKIIDEFGVGVQAVTFVAAAGAFSSGLVQATYGIVTRYVERRWLMAAGGVLFGLGFAAQA